MARTGTDYASVKRCKVMYGHLFIVIATYVIPLPFNLFLILITPSTLSLPMQKKKAMQSRNVVSTSECVMS